MQPCDCGSTTFLGIHGKVADMGTYSVLENGAKTVEKSGYAPYIENVCGGDYIDIKICMSCGHVHGFEEMSVTGAQELFEGEE